MPRKPAVTLRRPPSSVDAFVAGGDVQAPGYPEAQASKHLDSQTSERSVIVRKDGRQRRRTTVYFEPALAKKLKVYCAAEGRELSAVVSEAVEAFIQG